MPILRVTDLRLIHLVCDPASSDGKLHEANVLDQRVPGPGAFRVMARGCIDFARPGRFQDAGGFFAVRARPNPKARRRYAPPVDRGTGLICDQAIVRTGSYSRKGLAAPLRRIKFEDPGTGGRRGVLTNNSALPVALADRVVLQMDQAASSCQGLLRRRRERGQDADRDRGVGLRARGDRQKAAPALGGPLGNPANLLSPAMLARIPLDQLLTGSETEPGSPISANQLNLFE